VTLKKGDFEKGPKSTGRNIEIHVKAFNGDGRQIGVSFYIFIFYLSQAL
jgi:hypothetical protein